MQALLEREREFAAIEERIEAARGGEGSLLLVEAPAGLGKTGLLQAARETGERAGMAVLRSRGSELERDFPFALVRQLLEPVVHAAREAERAELLEGAARPAAAVVGLDGESTSGGADAPFDPSFTILNALYWLTSNIAERQPVLMVVDDAHWADAPSLRFLKFLMPRLEDLPILAAVAARPAEPGAEVELLEAMAADPAARVLRPEPLTGAAVTELVRAGLSRTADDAFCGACHQATGGNPFMLRELLVEVAADGSLGGAADAAAISEVAPATIQRSVLMRVGRLGEPAPRLARAVAVLGDDAELREAAVLAGADTGAAGEAADALASAGVLEPGRPLRFVHPLVRTAVYADLPAAAKAASHRQAAKLLEDRGAEPERRAIHLLVTDPDADPDVVATLDAAARRALERAAPEAALAYVRRALKEPPAASARPALLRRLVPAWFRALEGSASVKVLEAELLEEITADAQLLRESAVELSWGLYVRGQLERSAALLERAIVAAVDARDYGLAARLESFLAFWTQMGPVEAKARLDRYRDLIEPDTPGERVWLAMQALWGIFTGEPRETVAQLARRALEDGRIWDEQSENMIPASASSVLYWTDELEAAERAIEQNLSTSRARGAPGEIAAAMYGRGELAYLRGEVAQAEADARAAVEASRQGGFGLAYPMWVALLLEVLIERDELAAAEAELATMGMAEPMPDGWWYVPLLFAWARLRLAQGRAPEALEHLLAAGESMAKVGAQAPYSPGGSYVALALARVDQADEARQVAEQELADARAWGLPRRIGVALRTIGLLEGGESGLERLREALAVLEPSPARLEYMWSLAEYGAALRRAGRRADAREPLRQALDFAHRAGATALARRAHDELAATGAKPRKLVLTGVAALTPSERRVADMAAEGHRNRDIAQALFVTVKTVETHLGHVYQKLDIGSRGELAAALDQGDGAGPRPGRAIG